jgi:APA family basic amino acid/polyamine antiporter
MMIGFDVYLWYGIKNSFLSSNLPGTISQGNRVIGWSGLALSVLLAIVAFIHHGLTEADNPDTGLFYFSLIFAAIHGVIFGSRLAKK